MTDSATPTSTEPKPPADERLDRIEAMLNVLAARTAAGPAPSGYSAQAPISLAVQAAQAAGYLPGGEKLKSSWKDWPVIRHIRLIFGLYTDRRYTPSRAAQLGVPGIVVALVLNWFFWHLAFTLPILAPILEYLCVIVLAIALYRVVVWELGRYEAVLDYLKRTYG